MNQLEQLASMLWNTWWKTSLEELRIQVEREDSGIAFESVRADGGRRFMIVLCATEIDQIALLEKSFDFIDHGVTEDWNKLTLAHLAIRLIQNGGGLRFESRKDEYGRRNALALVAIEPASIRILETIFEMPK
jgi:hypothetical protein